MYQGRTFIRESVYVCGNYMDADIYPVFQKPGRRRSRCKPTSEIQRRLNQKNAEKRLTRLVHTNFTEDDVALHLTYRPGEEPETKEGAQRDLQNYIRRLKRRYTKLGKEFKYISCTEYGKKTNRIHHHLIISGGLDRDEIEKLWGRGYANSIRLQFGPDGVTGLAHYIAKDKLFFRHWNQSRNLVQPEPAQYDGKITLDEVGSLVDAIEEKNAWVQLEQRYPFHAGQSQRFDAANFPGRLCAERNRPAHPGAAGRDRPPGEREPDAGHEAAGDVHREKCGTI